MAQARTGKLSPEYAITWCLLIVSLLDLLHYILYHPTVYDTNLQREGTKASLCGYTP